MWLSIRNCVVISRLILLLCVLMLLDHSFSIVNSPIHQLHWYSQLFTDLAWLRMVCEVALNDLILLGQHLRISSVWEAVITHTHTVSLLWWHRQLLYTVSHLLSLVSINAVEEWRAHDSCHIDRSRYQLSSMRLPLINRMLYELYQLFITLEIVNVDECLHCCLNLCQW